MSRTDSTNLRTLILFIIAIPIFLLSSLLIQKRYSAYHFDFAAYWQAAHMVLSGQDIYNSQQWIAERTALGTALHSELTFQYPLPFAILMVPFGSLPVPFAYTLWISISQVAILASIMILLGFHPQRSMFVELLVIGGIFLFRPMFTVIVSGQILSQLLLIITLSIYLFRKENWFWGGFLLSLTTLKPSIGLPILLFVGFWLAARKRWTGMVGITSGAVMLFLVGALYAPNWVADYLSTGQRFVSKYYGFQTTLWGLAGFVFKTGGWGVIIGALASCGVVIVEGYFLLGKEFDKSPLLAMASILPASLLATPYSWSYDQILLIVPIVFSVLKIWAGWGNAKAVLFLIGIIASAIAFDVVAYLLNRDVWSVLVSAIVWISVLIFASRDRQGLALLQTTV
jgi:hypothetical protein